MDGFILMGSGFQHVHRDQLELLDDGVLIRSDRRDIYPTSAAQRRFFDNGTSIGQPSWGNLLNDLVTVYVARGTASDAIAQQCYVELGQAERRAAASMDIAEIAFQRVKEAALGFNLLAIGSTWRPTLAQSLPYWSRDWVSWSDKYLAEFERAEQSAPDFKTRIAIDLASKQLRVIRQAFATGARPTAPRQSQAGGPSQRSGSRPAPGQRQPQVEIRGSTQVGFVTNPTVKAYWNGKSVGELKSLGGHLVFAIASPGALRLKAGLRSATVQVDASGAVVYLGWDRTWGRLIASREPYSGT